MSADDSREHVQHVPYTQNNNYDRWTNMETANYLLVVTGTITFIIDLTNAVKAVFLDWHFYLMLQ